MNIMRTALTAALLTGAVAITPSFAQLGGAVGGTVGAATGAVGPGGSAAGGMSTGSNGMSG